MIYIIIYFGLLFLAYKLGHEDGVLSEREHNQFKRLDKVTLDIKALHQAWRDFSNKENNK